MILFFYIRGMNMNLREARFRKRFTQYDLVKLTGVHQSRISLIERDYSSPTRKEKLAIARALGIDHRDIHWTSKK